MMRTLVMLAMYVQAQAPAPPAGPPPPTGPPKAVTKIVNMLKKMQDTLLSEAKKDEEVYEKMSCWCTVNDKEKTESIAAAERAIDQYTSTIEEKTALTAQLKTEIEGLVEEMAKAQEAIDTATAMREEDHAEFSAEEKELMETGAAEGLKRKALDLLQQPAGYKSYNSRSGEIFGILKTMKETFETNLAKTRADEAEAQKRFDELIAEKKTGINAAKERKNTKVTELSEAKVALVQAKADLKDVRNNLDADTKFLVDLKEKCSASDKEFMERQKSRQEELVAVGEALKMLTDDSARDLFSSTLGFVQLRELRSVKRKQLVDALQKAAKKSGSPKI